MKKFLFLCATLFFAAESQAEQQFPTEFNVSQHWFSWGSDFTIATEDAQLGSLHRAFMSSEYQFLDNDGKLQATGKYRSSGRLSSFDVTNNEGQLFGKLEQKSDWYPLVFQIISPSEMVQAEASRNFWGTTYTVVDPQCEENVIATLSCSFLKRIVLRSNDWKIKIHNPELFLQKELDSRLFVILAAFETDQVSIALWAKLTGRSSARSALDKTIEKLRTELESARDGLNPVEPTEEDFEAVDAIVTQKLKEESKNVDLDDDSSLDELESGYEIMLPMLTEEGLSPSQKNALFLMMDHLLKSLK